MEQKTINQNKLQTILCIIALTLGVLVSAVLFSMPPVHASSFALTSNAGVFEWHYKTHNDNLNADEELIHKFTIEDSSYFYALACVGSSSDGRKEFKFFKYSLSSGVILQATSPSYTVVRVLTYSDGTSKTSNAQTGANMGGSHFLYVDDSGTPTDAYYFNFPIFASTDAMKNYCESGDKNGMLIDPVVPDLSDDSYTFTGFSINGKTARWTGTTERSHLKDQEVEEYTRITYGFATSEDQTLNDDNFIKYDQDFAVGEKQMTIPWSEIENNKKDGEFIRQVNFIPCYRVPGAFYLGKGVKVFYKSDGSIDKIEYAQKQTDLNTGNMIFDSSIGYLQNVIYTEEKTHDGKGRQATFKWSTSKALPDDAQVEIVAQNFYIEWFNKKTEENFIYKEYGEDCIYKNGSFSFNANTPVWTWLNEKEIDPFSVKTQSYGTKEYYLRIVTYNEKDSMYHYGGWVRVNVKSKDATNMPTTDVETGGFDDNSGLWNKDSDSDDSYHYSTDDKGDLTGNISVSDWEDLNINSFTWMYRNLQSMVQSLGQLPTMVSTIFGFLPNQVITALSVLLITVVLMRFLGR